MNWISFKERRPKEEPNPERELIIKCNHNGEIYHKIMRAQYAVAIDIAQDPCATRWAEIEPPPKPDPVSSFASDVLVELSKARESHTAINSLHEGYAVILEEMDELWIEVRLKRSQRNHRAIWSELVQVGAMAQRLAEDVVLEQLTDKPKEEQK